MSERATSAPPRSLSRVHRLCRRRGYRLGIEYDSTDLTAPCLQVRYRDRDDWADCDLIASVPFGQEQADLGAAANWLWLFLRRMEKEEEAA